MTNDRPQKTYLGDGAYADISNATGDLILTTENGISAQNTVVLEPEHFALLEAYIKGVRSLKIGRWKDD
jgi:hypothetical protein